MGASKSKIILRVYEIFFNTRWIIFVIEIFKMCDSGNLQIFIFSNFFLGFSCWLGNWIVTDESAIRQ
jgi:hypothetical protein